MNEDSFLSCEERNYSRDSRVNAVFIPQPPEGVAFEWAVCDLCDGHGHVVNPSIDASGLSAEDFENDPDFADDYRSGVYDIVCPKCRGRTTIPVFNRPTLAQAKALLRAIGVSLNKTDFGEYRVNLANGTEETAYYTDDILDAIGTGRAMIDGND